MTIQEKAQALAILGYEYGDIANYCILHDLESINSAIEKIYDSLPKWA